jgi:hypothetical protein
MFFENVGLDQLQVVNGLAEFRVKIKRQSPHRATQARRLPDAFGGDMPPRYCMVFLQNSLRNLAGNFRAEFDPEQGIRIPEQGI